MRRLAFGIAALALCTLPALADDSVPGHAIVGRITDGNALVLYDVTPEVKDITTNHVSDADGTVRLERDALRALASVAAKVPSAKSFEVRVTYFKTGDVSPAYGAPTFAGVEKFAVLKMSVADVKSDKDKWKEASAATSTDPLPKSVSFTVLGALPPQS